MIYALKSDVVAIDTLKGIVAGNVRLRSTKRPRPIVLRMNSGDCLRITFTNLLSPTALSDQPATRSAGIHVIGMELVGSLGSDGSNVGVNAPSLVAPGGSTIYTLFATREGNNLMYSSAATTSGEGDGGQQRRRITTEGDLLVTSQRYRDQDKNRADVLEKLRELLIEAAFVPKARKATKPSRGSKERRHQAKQHRSATKAGRRVPGEE